MKEYFKRQDLMYCIYWQFFSDFKYWWKRWEMKISNFKLELSESAFDEIYEIWYLL